MRYLLTLITSLLLTVATFAQNAKNDVILKTNGETLTGKVMEILDNDIKFTHAGETLIYTIKKSDIQQITFSSGRVEKFTQPAAATVATVDAGPADVDPRNKVAILPFTFTKDGEVASEEVGIQVQNECYALLSKHAGVYTIVPTRRTDVLLNKAGITRATINNYTMDEICKILGVEYIIDGTVSQNKTTQTSYGNSTYNEKKKDDDKKTAGTTSNYQTSTQNYQTSLDLKIYNNKGATIYSQNRKAFWNTADAYKNTLEYLIKRCPLYTK